MIKLTPRQVHLDFHTSEKIKGIGSNFSRENFIKALKLGNLSSITIFAKCHHAMCYYPTKVGIQHPYLDFDMVGEMIEAAHSINVKAPIYITAGWSAQDALDHPEWRQVDTIDGQIHTNYDFTKKDEDDKIMYSWIKMCLNDNGYCEHIYDLTREICDRYKDIDGLFYDICYMGGVCYCETCKAGMKEMGLNPEIEADAKKYYVIKHNDFARKCQEILSEKHENASIFFNSGGADQYRPQYHDAQSHFELEDLPTAWGGYDKMPPRAKFFANTGKDFLGMTGKFHTAWGEFGGFKLPEAIKFECAAMLMYGAKCSIGDQMHPDGEMDLETYRNIGYGYNYVKQIEQYCYDVKETTTLGLYLSGDEKADEGVVKMLLETQNDFDIVYKDDFTKFDTVIFPEHVKVCCDSAKKIEKFVANGGKALVMGDSLIDEDGNFIIDTGAKYNGKIKYELDYLVVGDKVKKDMVTTPILMYTPSTSVTLTTGEEISSRVEPYFRRTYGTYCSHKNTPYNKENQFVAGVKNKNVVYLGHELGTMYYDFGCTYHKRYFINALNMIYTKADKVMNVSLMSAGRARLAVCDEKNRYCLHLLYGSPVQRGEVSVIEDLPAIYNTKVSIKTDKAIKCVFSAVTNKDIVFENKDGFVEFIVDEFTCHELVVIEY